MAFRLFLIFYIIKNLLSDSTVAALGISLPDMMISVFTYSLEEKYTKKQQNGFKVAKCIIHIYLCLSDEVVKALSGAPIEHYLQCVVGSQ